MAMLAELDQEKSAVFADRLLEMLNHGALSLMISIGHRTGLFDVMGDGAWATSEDIAERAGLQERYVREWLGAMVTGRIAEYEPARRAYRLPAEHAAFLTHDAAPNNIAAFMQYVGVLGAVEDSVTECFKHGGGVPYGAFKRFHEVMAEDSGQTVLAALEDAILPLVSGLTAELERGIDVLDVGCGSGRAVNQMARTYPRSTFRGIDFSEDAIARARAEADKLNLRNVRFDVEDAASLSAIDAYDLITTFDAIHDQAHPARVLANIRRALRPNGTYLMQDISGTSHLERDIEHPIGAFLYSISTMHCMTVSLAADGVGLGTMWGEERATNMLRSAGFRDIRIERLAHDFQNVYFVIRKSPPNP